MKEEKNIGGNLELVGFTHIIYEKIKLKFILRLMIHGLFLYRSQIQEEEE